MDDSVGYKKLERAAILAGIAEVRKNNVGRCLRPTGREYADAIQRKLAEVPKPERSASEELLTALKRIEKLCPESEPKLRKIWAIAFLAIEEAKANL